VPFALLETDKTRGAPLARTIGKDLSEREELQKTSVAADGALSSKLHYEAFSTSVAGRRKVQRQICHLVKTQTGH